MNTDFMRLALAHDHLSLVDYYGTVLERYEHVEDPDGDAYGNCTILSPNYEPRDTRYEQRE